jgi:hypothetical protein
MCDVKQGVGGVVFVDDEAGLQLGFFLLEVNKVALHFFGHKKSLHAQAPV